MAIVQLPVATATIVYRDERGSLATVQAYLPATTTLAAATTALDGLRVAVSALSNAVPVSQSLTWSFKETALATPQADSRVEDKGVFIFNCANGQRVTLQVPAIDLALVEPSGRIDDDSAAALALQTAVIGVPFVSNANSQITSLYAAYDIRRSTTRNRKPRNRYVD